MSKSTDCFSVQTFRTKGKGIEPQETRIARDELHAISLADRLAASNAGVVALRQTTDPDCGVVEEPIVLAIHGRVPPIFQELPF